METVETMKNVKKLGRIISAHPDLPILMWVEENDLNQKRPCTVHTIKDVDVAYVYDSGDHLVKGSPAIFDRIRAELSDKFKDITDKDEYYDAVVDVFNEKAITAIIIYTEPKKE